MTTYAADLALALDPIRICQESESPACRDQASSPESKRQRPPRVQPRPGSGICRDAPCTAGVGCATARAARLRRRESVARRELAYLLAGKSAAGDDGDSADLEELHFVLPVVVGCVVSWRISTSWTVIGNLVQILGFVGLTNWGKRAAGEKSHDCADEQCAKCWPVRLVRPNGDLLQVRVLGLARYLGTHTATHVKRPSSRYPVRVPKVLRIKLFSQPM